MKKDNFPKACVYNPSFDDLANPNELDNSPLRRQPEIANHTTSSLLLQNTYEDADQFRPNTHDIASYFRTVLAEGLRRDEDSFKYTRTLTTPPVTPLASLEELPCEPISHQETIVGSDGTEYFIETVFEDTPSAQTKSFYLGEEKQRVELDLFFFDAQQNEQPIEVTQEALVEGCSKLADQLRATELVVVEPKLYHSPTRRWCYRQRLVPLMELAKEGHVVPKTLAREVEALLRKHSTEAVHSSNISYSWRLGRYVLDYLHQPMPGHQLTLENCESIAKMLGSAPEIKAEVVQYADSQGSFQQKIGSREFLGRFIPALDPPDYYLVGSGSYGKIFIDTKNTSSVKKRVFYSRNSYKSCKLECVNELCMLRMCSEFVSPRVSSMDIRQSARFFEFEMERCLPIHDIKIQPELLDKLCESLTSQVTKMHQLQIYHRDIKPENILYSDRLKSLVLIDFGLSLHTSKKYPGGRQFSVFCGTIKYMSAEMANLQKEGLGFIDLAKSDLVALEKSLAFIKQRNADNKEPITDLSSAFVERAGLDRILEGLIFNWKIHTRTSRGSIFARLSKLGLVDMAKRMITSITKLAGPEELFEVVKLLIKHHVKQISPTDLKNLLEKPLDQKEQDTFNELLLEYDIMKGSVDEAVERYKHYCNSPDATWIRKRYIIFVLAQKVWLEQQPGHYGSVEKLLELYPPTEATAEISCLLMHILAAACKRSEQAEAQLSKPMKALADALLPKLANIGNDYPHISGSLHHILENVYFRDTVRVDSINQSIMIASCLSRPIVECNHLRKVLLEMFRSNCDNEQMLLQALDSMFLHDNGLAQEIQYSHPFNYELVEQISGSIPKQSSINCSKSLLKLNLLDEEVVRIRNILLVDFKPDSVGPTTLKVLVGDLEVTLDYCISTANPDQIDAFSIFLRGEDIQVRVVSCPLQNGNKEEQIEEFVRSFVVRKIVSMNSGLKLLTVLGCDFVIYPTCIRFLELAHEPAIIDGDAQKQQQCHSDLIAIIQYLHSHRIVVRNIAPAAIAYCPFDGKYVLVDFTKARGITDEPSSDSPAGSIQSYTEVCGNELCIGQEMKRLVESHELTGRIDLFLNDLQALERAVRLLSASDQSITQTIANQPQVNHIEYLLKTMLSEEWGDAKWVLRTVQRYLIRRPNFFRKVISKEYLWLDDSDSNDKAIEDIEDKLKDKYAIQQMCFRHDLLRDQFFTILQNHLYSLVELDLAHNGFTSAVVETFQSLNMPVLRSLNLYDNLIGDDALKLFTCNMRSIQELNIGCNQLTECSLADPKDVKVCKLKQLDCSWNDISLNPLLVSLFEVLKNLQHINLEYTNVSLEDVARSHLFATAGRTCQIRLTVNQNNETTSSVYIHRDGSLVLHNPQLKASAETASRISVPSERQEQLETMTVSTKKERRHLSSKDQ